MPNGRYIAPVIYGESMRYVPNALSLSRIPLSIALFIFAMNEVWGWAVLCFSIALATDALDGEIARRFKVESSLGGNILEPVCDLVLAVAVVGGLYFGGVWPLWVPITLAVINVLLQISHSTPFTRLKRHTYYLHPLFFLGVVCFAGADLFDVWEEGDWSIYTLSYVMVWAAAYTLKRDRVMTWLAGPPTAKTTP